jgi:hypothetical protein
MSATFGSQDGYAFAAQEDRCAPRIRITIPATLRPSGSRGFQTVVHDLSISGFSAMAINRLHPGTHCWLTLPGLESMHGQVVWWEDGVVGCSFHQLISPIVHESILSRWAGLPSYDPPEQPGK